MKKRSISRLGVAAGIADMMIGLLVSTAAMARMDQGPKTDKTYSIGLPRQASDVVETSAK